MQEKLSAIMHDEAFLEKLFALEEPEDVQKLFSDNGVEMTLDEVKAIGKALGELDFESGELTEDDLKDVAGGSIVISTLAMIAGAFVIGSVAYCKWRRIRESHYRW